MASAPEQFEGRPVSSAVDIYALGLVLYEMVTGKHAFLAASPIGAAVRRAKRLLPSSMRPVQHPHTTWQNRAHFFAVAAKRMRHILVGHARADRAQKRLRLRIGHFMLLYGLKGEPHSRY
jgi:serine/threonine protein kinase